MPFECAQCGECCSHLGLVHVIKEDYGNNRFLLLNQYTGETNKVVIDSDKIDLYADNGIFEREPEACPFFRVSRADNKGYCTIHATRPEICRDFSCWRLLILDGQGKRAGRVMFTFTFVSEDPQLKRLWQESVDPIIADDPAVWDHEVIRILTKAGYFVRS